jgi:hypothetical protein
VHGKGGVDSAAIRVAVVGTGKTVVVARVAKTRRMLRLARRVTIRTEDN